MGGVKCRPSQHQPIDDPGEYEMKRSEFVLLASLTCVSACTIAPTAPSVMALPGTGKTFDQFRIDDGSCRQFASGQVGGVLANQAATASGAGRAALGTALGAAAGAAFNGGRGAAVGAGAGLLAGSVLGAGAAQTSADEVQRRYDSAYVQCMYAAGDRVPLSGRLMTAPAAGRNVPPPPPPPGSPPPPES